jgi:glycosyltransferase involved in cell wall biosynthesis
MNISVVIPTHNRAHTLSRALDSVLAQESSATEIIVVDDGSNDGTDLVLRDRYAGVRVLYQQQQGVSAARNRGIRAAAGEWIALLDSDDAWLPTKLATQTRLLRNHPGHRLCHTDEIWIRNGVRVNPMNKHAKAGGNIFRACLPRCVISPSSAVIHRSVFDDIGLFDEKLPACEDYDLWLRVCSREPVLFVDTPQIVKYGGHDDQLSRQYWGMDRFRVEALEKLLTNGILDDETRAATAAALAEKARILATGAEKRGNTEMAARYRRLHRRHAPESAE